MASPRQLSAAGNALGVAGLRALRGGLQSLKTHLNHFNRKGELQRG